MIESKVARVEKAHQSAEQIEAPPGGAKSPHIFFENLDGLRFVAFSLVFIQHAFLLYYNSINPANVFKDNALKFMLFSGETGVSVFFTLSGFLITYLLLSEKQSTGTVNVFKFYMRRILRIWPLYYLILFFLFIIYPFLKTYMGYQLSSHTKPIWFVLFLSNYEVIRVERSYLGQNSAMEGVTWSISVEEQFYLMWPLIFFIFDKRLLKYVFPGLIICCLFFRYYFRFDDLTLYYNTVCVIGDMVLGGFFAYWIFYSSRFKNFISLISKRNIIFIYLIGFAWLLFNDKIYSIAEIRVVHRLISCLFFSFIILEQNYCQNSWYKFSNFRFISSWGKYTYGLYLLHQIALSITTSILAKVFHYPENSSLSFNATRALLAITIAMVISYLSFEYFEKKALQLKGRFAFNRLKNHP